MKPNTGFLILEFTALFVVIPILYWLDLIRIHKMIPLVAVFLYCVMVLLKQKQFFSGWRLKASWPVIFARFFVVALAIVLYLYLSPDQSVFVSFENHRNLLLMVCLYPFLSAFPQEVIYRKFFFYRYQPLFPNPTMSMFVGVTLFAFAHLYFGSWVVILFTLAGGLLFSLTYLNTNSVLVASLEHTLYGLVILCSGLADFFYKAF